jgi:hypothetical protein
MNLVEEARSILEAAGYRTALASSSPCTLHFEDEIVLGAIFIHPSLSLLISSWEECQDRFLGSNSQVLRSDPVKVWNIYTVHLTADAGSPSQVSEAFNIEQDFRGTRKLVRAGVVTRTDVREALLPLLPLQHRLKLSPKNVTERLKERLALSSKVLVRLVELPERASIELDLLEEP